MIIRVVSILLASAIGATSAQAYLVPGPGSGNGGGYTQPNPPNYPNPGYQPHPGYPHNNNGGVNLGPHPYPEYGPSHPHYPHYPQKPYTPPYYPPHKPPYTPPPVYNPPYTPPYTPPYNPGYSDMTVDVNVDLGHSWAGTLELHRYVNLRKYAGMRLVAVEVTGEFTNYSACSNGRWDLVLKVNGSIEGQDDFCGSSYVDIQASEYIDGNERITLSILSAARIYSIRLRLSNY